MSSGLEQNVTISVRSVRRVLHCCTSSSVLLDPALKYRYHSTCTAVLLYCCTALLFPVRCDAVLGRTYRFPVRPLGDIVVVVVVVVVVTLKDLPDLHSPVEGHLMRMSSVVTG